ncbi:MAG: hypothetical protein KUG77_00885 [Nannocystaceae bacterium]|nr:hypothetical protein [Nannocystaceae bacterium]
MNGLALAVVAATTSTGPRVHLEVERGPEMVVLIAREAQPNEVRGLRRVRAQAACTAPCDAVMSPEAPGFFVAGEDVLPSSTFHLPPTGDVTVRVRAGRRSAFLTGWTLAGVGAPALLAGATLMTLADDDAGRVRVGAAIAGVGVVMVVTGAILIATGRTKLRFEPVAGP